MREELFKYAYAASWDYVRSEQDDLECELKEIGYDMGKRMLILKNFRPETSIESLLYRMAYILLPSFYESERILEKSDTDRNTYLLTENSPLMNQYVSLPSECASFTCDAIFAGAIESILRASGFSSEVTAHNVESLPYPNKVVYIIKIHDRDGGVVQL